MPKLNAGLVPILVCLVMTSAWAQETAPRVEAAPADAAEAARVVELQAEEERERAHAALERARALQVHAHQDALRAAAVDQRAALEAVEAARQELETRAREDAEHAREAEHSGRNAPEGQAREMEAVRRDLERAHESLRRATREVARVHREINRPEAAVAPGARLRFGGGDRAVIGVILGESNADGVRVLGVSPDGPAERAGLSQDDIIVSIMDTPLGGGEEDARKVLSEVMEGVKAGDELVIAVRRDGENREFVVVPETREPFTWYSYARLPSVDVDVSSDGRVIIEHIEVPEIDREALDRDLARLREELEATKLAVDGHRSMRIRTGEDEYVYEFDTEEFSGFGDAMLAGTNVWFGMPLVRGLKMAEVEPGLGEYFGTDRGVLVLKAREDNELLLEAGDVILSVGDTPVDKPADVMRALRNLESGTQLDIGIKRGRKNRTLSIEVPENRYGFNALITGFPD